MSKGGHEVQRKRDRRRWQCGKFRGDRDGVLFGPVMFLVCPMPRERATLLGTAGCIARTGPKSPSHSVRRSNETSVRQALRHAGKVIWRFICGESLKHGETERESTHSIV